MDMHGFSKILTDCRYNNCCCKYCFLHIILGFILSMILNMMYHHVEIYSIAEYINVSSLCCIKK